jgi:CO/xanthine dehydrogenase FAD-binding subunit
VGSIAHADPSAEIPLVALLLDAVLDVHGGDGIRSIPIGEFFFGYLTTALDPSEVIAAVRFPDSPLSFGARRGTAFTEMARREGDFALVAVACQLDLDDEGRVLDVRLGLGGVAPVPVRLTDAEASLKGNRVSDRLFREIAQTAAQGLEPDEDLHATVEYRRHVARELTVQALQAASAEAAAQWGELVVEDKTVRWSRDS